MLQFILDEHVDPSVVAAVHALEPTVDVLRMQEVGLRTRSDPVLIAWACQHDRLIVTNDRRLVSFAYAQLATGAPFPGVVVYSNQSSIGKLAEDIVLVAVTHTPEQAENQVFYSPI